MTNEEASRNTRARSSNGDARCAHRRLMRRAEQVAENTTAPDTAKEKQCQLWRPICCPMTCSLASTSVRRCTTARTASSTRTWEDLRDSGYLPGRGTRPSSGGSGLLLDDYVRLQQRLAYVAPATALAVNMHCYWTGLAADLVRAGDESCRWMLERAAAGDVFCALHGEAGNDLPLMLAVATADRVDGGWEISGHKIFGSLTPVWTLGGFHAMDTLRSRKPADRARVPAAGRRRRPDHRHLGHPRHAGHAEPGHGARQARSSRTTSSRSSVPPASPARARSRSASSPGR